ncbi:MAG: hypothetical protein ACYSTF_01710 [Planctomycetota bacterium]|jgi:hypothetical protein
MKKKGILLIAVILLIAGGLVQAQEKKLSGTIDVTYLSSYIWRGFDYYADDHSVIQPSIDIDLYGTGFGVNVLWSRAISAPFENAERISLALYYGSSLFLDKSYNTDYKVGWVYYGFPDEPRAGSKTDPDAQAADMQEFFASFSWPEICPAGIVPSYTILTMWPSEGDSAARKNSGWAHIFGLGYDLAVPGILEGTKEQILHLSAAAVYNDGVAPGVVIGTASGTVDHDWSHAVFGISTDFDLGHNLSFTPGVYYQSSWEDTVNTEDETWVSLSMKYRF